MSINDIQIVDSFTDLDWGLKAINAPMVWQKTKGEGVTIVTMDTGADINHPDIQGKVKSTFNFINSSLDVTDESGHGSHVTGLLVGEKTGVAPRADIHVLKVLNKDGIGSLRSITDGITHAMNLKADVLSISLGSMNEIPQLIKQRLLDAIGKGVTIVSATGNMGRPEAFYPARLEQVIAVGGLDKNMNLTNWTNMGYDVLAPSVDILSTYKDNNYAIMTGTSMASPLVAGSIALLISYYRSQGKSLRPNEIHDMLKGTKLDLAKLIG